MLRILNQKLTKVNNIHTEITKAIYYAMTEEISINDETAKYFSFLIDETTY